MALLDASPNIPVFPLYGEEGAWETPEPLHCEEIAARSMLHNWEIKPHRHDDLAQLLHIASGKAKVSLDGKVSERAGPCLVFVPPRVVHGFAFDPQVKGHVITLPAPVLRRLVSAGEREFARPLLMTLMDLPEMAGDIAQHVAALAREFSGTQAGRLAALEARLTLILIAISRQQAAPPSQARESRHEARTRRFYDLVETGYARHMSVEDYASRLSVTAVQLNKSLKQAVGKSALAILHERLVLEAKRSLIYTNSSISDIATLLGFVDAAYFSRFFTRLTGQAPRDYRREALMAMRADRS